MTRTAVTGSSSPSGRLITITLILLAAASFAPARGSTDMDPPATPRQSLDEDPQKLPVRASPLAPVTTAAEAQSAGPKSIANSSVNTEQCYEPNASRSLCFTVHNGSDDSEWLDTVDLTFPNFGGLGPWSIACNSQDANDSSGHPVGMACSTPSTNRVLFNDNVANGWGEITSGSSWGFCVTANIPAGYNGPRIVNWSLSGDETPGSATPHELAGQVVLEQCTPLMLFPEDHVVKGCAGLAQTLPIEVWNNTGAAKTIGLTYQVTSGNGVLSGPPSITVPAGALQVIQTDLATDPCLAPGTSITGTVGADNGTDSDSVSITQTTVTDAGWDSLKDSAVPTMDNVVVWAVADGGLWSIGGYDASGATQRYDFLTDTWTTHSTEPAPIIEYPMDGCYGLGPTGDEVVVLFPDTDTAATTLHRYNITDDMWETPPIPTGFPPAGRWAQDIVSLYALTGQNVCYLSGGSTEPGGGQVSNLWEYHPDTNISVFLGNFTHHPSGFNFHASWHVPWVGTGGAICVGGGVDQSSGMTADTQCYDLTATTFNPPNADLGPLPEPWWGMADGWRTADGRHQIWIGNGVAQDGMRLPTTAYADETTGGFVSGPEIPVALYRLEGDGLNGQFYMLQGSTGSFTPSKNTLHLEPCPVCLPSLIFEDGFEFGDTRAWSSTVP